MALLKGMTSWYKATHEYPRGKRTNENTRVLRKYSPFFIKFPISSDRIENNSTRMYHIKFCSDILIYSLFG